MEIKISSLATLKKYGLTEDDFRRMWREQGGRCSICLEEFVGGTINIDHEHVFNWKRMPPERRRIYVRALTCWQCNRFRLFRGANAKLAYNMYQMLTAYEQRRDKMLAEYTGPTQLLPAKKKRKPKTTSSPSDVTLDVSGSES